MDEIIFGEILKRISLVAIALGALTGLDLLFGAKVISIFDKATSRKFPLDEAVTRAKARIMLGVIFLFICICMILVVVTSR